MGDPASSFDIQTVLTILGSLVAGGTVDRLVRALLERRREAQKLKSEEKQSDADILKAKAEAAVVEANAIVIHMGAWKELVQQHKEGESAAKASVAEAEAKLERQGSEMQALKDKVAHLEAANDACELRAKGLDLRIDAVLETNAAQERQIEHQAQEIARLDGLVKELLERIPRDRKAMPEGDVTPSTEPA